MEPLSAFSRKSAILTLTALCISTTVPVPGMAVDCVDYSAYPRWDGGLCTGNGNGVWGVALDGNHAHIAGGLFALLHIVDITDPSRPTLVGSLDYSSSGAWDVAVQGDYAYLAARFWGFGGFGAEVSGDYALFSASGDQSSGDPHKGVEIFDVSDPLSPSLVTTLYTDDMTNQLVVWKRGEPTPEEAS
jgi:hypothetical protein